MSGDGKKQISGTLAFLIGTGLAIIAILWYQSTKPSGSSTSGGGSVLTAPLSQESLAGVKDFCTEGLKGSLEGLDGEGHDDWIMLWKGLVEGANLVSCDRSINQYLAQPTIQLQLPPQPQTYVLTLGTTPITVTVPTTTP